MTAWKSINGANFIRLTLKAFCVDAQPACKHQDVASVLISLLIHPNPTVLPILSHIPLHVPQVCIQASGDRPPCTQSAVCIKKASLLCVASSDSAGRRFLAAHQQQKASFASALRKSGKALLREFGAPRDICVPLTC